MSTRPDPLADSRRRLAALEARRAAGGLDDAAYDTERRALERELADRVLAAGAPRVAADAKPARPSRALVGLLAVLVLGVAVAGYAVKGSPQLARAGLGGAAYAQAADPSASGADTREASLQQIAAMVSGLSARLKERPDDAEGWFMLARSYTVLGRFAEALPAYTRADQLRPNNAALLADWADATAAARNSIVDPGAIALIARALAADPDQPKALALAGTSDYERGDFTGAIRRWQRLADRLPAGSELRGQVDASIADARAKGGLSAAPDQATTAAASNPPTAVASVSGSASGAVSGTVALAPALAASAAPGDTVFVFARAASGPRMPLAVRRVTVADLPLTFSLDDSMAMTPAMTISKADRVVVSARISRSGNATPQPGDLSGESAPVRPGAAGIAVTIDSVAR